MRKSHDILFSILLPRVWCTALQREIQNWIRITACGTIFVLMISDEKKIAFEEHLISVFWITFLFLYFFFYSIPLRFDSIGCGSLFPKISFRVFHTKHWLARAKITAFAEIHTVKITKRNLSNGTHRRATDTTNTKPYNNHHHLKMKAKFELVLVWPPKKKNISHNEKKHTLLGVAASRVFVCVRFFSGCVRREKKSNK